MAELRASIVGEFKGKKAFKDADKATVALDKGVKRLGASLLAAFSVQKLTTFSKNAVKAFAENEKSAKRLETVVKNLGLAFEIPGIEANLDKISAKFGYEGEVLREAFQKLITTTGSAKKSQDLLNLSLDIAAGSGVDLLTVNQDLAAAYVGQTRGLRKYNLGLTQSELRTLDFDSAVTKLSANFKGAGTNELTTYSGKMRVLQEAADNAQEIIGGSLVDSLALLAGDGNSIQPLADSMQEFGTFTGDAVFGLAKLINKMKEIPAVGGLLNAYLEYSKYAGVFGVVRLLSEYGAQPKPGMGGYPSSALGPGYIDPNIAARKKAEAEAAKREAARLKREKESAAAAAKALAAQKKSALEQKKANALTKAAQTLDLTRIGIAAALKNQISETDRLSLNLQLALLDENDDLATKLSKQLETAVERQNQLNALLLATPKAPNPYSNWIPPSFTLSTPTLTPTATPTLTPTATPTLTPTLTPTATETLAATTASEAAALIALITETADALGVTTTTPITTTTATTTTATAITTQLIEATDSLASALEFSATDSSFLASSTDAMLELLDAFNSAQAAQAAAESVAAAVDKVGDIYIKVEVDGTEIASSAKTELTNQSLSGSFVNVNRLGRFANVPTAL